jgi:hypothetical protein
MYKFLAGYISKKESRGTPIQREGKSQIDTASCSIE